MNEIDRQTFSQLESGLDQIRQAPADNGTVQLIVRRPFEGKREVVAEAELDLEQGLVGDNWRDRGSRMTDDGAAHPGMQLTMMSARVIALIAQEKDRWALAGDQFFVDLDLSHANLPAGTRLEIGSAVVEVTPLPHNGCKLFAGRYGADAVKFVNSPLGKQLRLRGLNAKVVRPGRVLVGDVVRKIATVTSCF
jgi:MOSC domain-containing protein YiiM